MLGGLGSESSPTATRSEFYLSWMKANRAELEALGMTASASSRLNEDEPRLEANYEQTGMNAGESKEHLEGEQRELLLERQNARALRGLRQIPRA